MRVRLLGLILLMTAVCLGSYFYRHREYVTVAQPSYVEVEPRAVAPAGPLAVPEVEHSIVRYQMAPRPMEIVDVSGLRHDVALAITVLLGVYVFFTWLNHRAAAAS